MLEYDPPALTVRPGGDFGDVQVQMFNSTAMHEQALLDVGALRLTETRAPGDIDVALLTYHEHIVLPRLYKHLELSEYLETFMSALLQRLREAEVLRDESPNTETARLMQRLNRQESRLDLLNNEVGRLKDEVGRLKEEVGRLMSQGSTCSQRGGNPPQTLEERVRSAQYAAYQQRGSSRRAPSRDGSCRSGTEDNGLPVSADVLYDAVCRSLIEGRARRSRPASDAGESNALSTPGSIYYPSDYEREHASGQSSSACIHYMPPY